MGYILAIDLGTTALKVALTDTQGQVVGTEGCDTPPVTLLPGGGAEQNADAWWQAVAATVRRLLARIETPVEEIRAIGCTAQWAGTVPVDRSGRPLRNAIIWMDSRGAADVRRITRGPLMVQGYGLDKVWRWLRKTGGIPALSGKDSLAHILYLQRQHPQLYEQTYKFLEPKDFLNLRLTGRFAATYDSIALHWVTDNRDPRRIRYDDGLLRLAGLHREKLPDLLAATDVVGPLTPEAAEELGLPPGIPVVGGTPDLHSAGVGAGATRDFQPHLYIGTSAWLSCHVPFKKTDLAHNMASLPSPVPGRYFIANEQETAGACLTWLRDNVLFHGDGLTPGGPPPDFWALLDRLAAEAPPGAGGTLFAPWLYGERTPVEDHALRGAFFNLSLQTTRPHLIRAVLEGVACNTRWLLEAVERFAGRRLEPVRFIGGGARSEVWCQILADVLDRQIEQAADPVQANVRGAALIAAAGIGARPLGDAGTAVAIARTFVPDPANRAAYDRLYATFRAFYRQSRRLYGDLNKGPYAN